MRDDAQKRVDANRRSSSTSAKPYKSGRAKPTADKENRGRGAKGGAEPYKSGRTKSAIRDKDAKKRKSTSSSVRFAETAEATKRPKLDIFSSSVFSKKKKTSTKSSKKSSTEPTAGTQSSGQHSYEGGGGARRRKKSESKVSTQGGKSSKARALAMKSFDDDGGFM